VPFNENHEGLGKIGTASRFEYLDNGSDGAGLYATEYDLTEVGKQHVRDGRFDATSAEMIWSINGGAKYQDPMTGKYHDDVIVGIALCDKPFFGHSNTALFSADKPDTFMNDMHHDARYSSHNLLDAVQTVSSLADDMKDVDGVGDLLTDAKDSLKKALSAIIGLFRADDPVDGFKDFSPERRRELAASGAAMPDGSYPIESAADLANAIQAVGRAKNQAAAKAHIKKRAKALGLTDKLPENWKDSTEVDVMADETKTQPDQVAVTPEQFVALRSQIEKMEADRKAEVERLTADNKALTERLAAEQRTRRLDQLRVHVERFTALPRPVTEEHGDILADRLLQLEEKSPELYQYFNGVLEAADAAIVAGGLFQQHSKPHAQKDVLTIEALADKIVAEKFGGDKSKWPEAFDLAGEQRPDLAQAYLRGGK
jgi:hypothetical protein